MAGRAGRREREATWSRVPTAGMPSTSSAWACKEMLADEMTRSLRVARDQARAEARRTGAAVTRPLVAKGVSFGAITARPDGSFDESGIEGVDADLRIRPFFAHGGTISIREFVVGALRAEMGLEIADPDTAAASTGARIITPAGMLLDGRADRIEAPPVANPYRDINGNVSGGELPTAIVDYLEFYLLNYFKPATYKQTDATRRGLQTFRQDRLRLVPRAGIHDREGSPRGGRRDRLRPGAGHPERPLRHGDAARRVRGRRAPAFRP